MVTDTTLKTVKEINYAYVCQIGHFLHLELLPRIKTVKILLITR